MKSKIFPLITQNGKAEIEEVSKNER